MVRKNIIIVLPLRRLLNQNIQNIGAMHRYYESLWLHKHCIMYQNLQTNTGSYCNMIYNLDYSLA